MGLTVDIQLPAMKKDLWADELQRFLRLIITSMLRRYREQYTMRQADGGDRGFQFQNTKMVDTSQRWLILLRMKGGEEIIKVSIKHVIAIALSIVRIKHLPMFNSFPCLKLPSCCCASKLPPRNLRHVGRERRSDPASTTSSI